MPTRKNSEFTEAHILRAEVRPSNYVIRDPRTPGLGAKITKAGHRSYVYNYRFENKDFQITIGEVGTVINLSQAREKAKMFGLMVHQNRNPLLERNKVRGADTVDALLNRYFDSASFKGNAKSTQDTDLSRAKYHIRPLIGKTPAHQLTPDAVRGMRAAIVAGKTAVSKPSEKPRGRIRVSGGEGAAGRTVTLLSSVYSWALKEGIPLITSNPALNVPGYSSVDRVIAPEEGEFAKIFQAMATLEENLIVPRKTLDALRLIALLGLRRGEAQKLKWRNVDLAAGTLTFGAQEHKTGSRTGDKTLVLTSEALKVLERQPRGKPTDFVFPPASGNVGLNLNKPWSKVAELAGLPKNFVLHGLRHSVGATMAKNGASAAEIAVILGHKKSSTAEIYIEFAKSSKQKIAARLSSMLTAELGDTKV